MRARDNPFSTDRVHRIRYRLRGQTWETLLNRLACMNYRGAIVGPDGSGKTTLLEDLEPYLHKQGFACRFLRLDRTTRHFPRGFITQFSRTLTRRDVVLFDGADLMSSFAWHLFRSRTKKAGGLVITAHRNGWFPTLTECKTSPELLEDIVVHLLAEKSDGTRDLSRDLYIKHGGNLRTALRELYDIYAGRQDQAGPAFLSSGQ